jgi:hypothetical protein
VRAGYFLCKKQTIDYEYMKILLSHEQDFFVTKKEDLFKIMAGVGTPASQKNKI